jgi:hypothetical protein
MVLFILLPVALLSFQFQWIFVLVNSNQIFVRLDCCWFFSAGKLKENDLKYWFPVIELVLIFTQINIFIKNIFSKPVHWK